MGNRTLHKRVEELENELVAIRKHIGLVHDEGGDADDDDADLTDENDEDDEDSEDDDE